MSMEEAEIVNECKQEESKLLADAGVASQKTAIWFARRDSRN